MPVNSYAEACAERSDINELLPKIRETAEGCDVVVEIGFRTGMSTWALLDAKPRKVVSVDINEGDYSRHKEWADANGVEYEFIHGDSLEIDIPECDFLFIDSLHTGDQVYAELTRHGSKAKKFLGFHDISSFGVRGEPVKVADGEYFVGSGLLVGINRYLADTVGMWSMGYMTHDNNGLLIIKRNEV